MDRNWVTSLEILGFASGEKRRVKEETKRLYCTLSIFKFRQISQRMADNRSPSQTPQAGGRLYWPGCRGHQSEDGVEGYHGLLWGVLPSAEQGQCFEDSGEGRVISLPQPPRITWAVTTWTKNIGTEEEEGVKYDSGFKSCLLGTSWCSRGCKERLIFSKCLWCARHYSSTFLLRTSQWGLVTSPFCIWRKWDAKMLIHWSKLYN